ncbi:MAG TPA: glycosyltransferase family 4 protein, partial [Anaerolinea sp.]|nr:glycosyltransferase family 4 protein [Anaerolinea sp.]
SQPRRAYGLCLADGLSTTWLDRLAALKVDVLLQDELNHPSLWAVNPRLRKKVRFPIVSIVHHLRSSEDHPAGWMRLYRQMERAYLRSVSGYVFNSATTQSAVEMLSGRPASLGVVATPAGDRLEGRLGEAQIVRRVKSRSELQVLFVGNLMPRKGLGTLLEALALARNARIHLRVVGRRDVDAAYTQQVDRQVERLGLAKRVNFLGAVEDARLVEEMKDADALVVPSQYEGFGIVYLEGMGFGLPAVGGSLGGAGEIIQDGANGLLVESGDAQGLAEGLERLADRACLLEMSLAARRRFAEFPGWEESMRRARDFLVEISGAK